MPSFSNRSVQKELLDGDHIPFSDIRRNMYELEIINRYLGGHKVTIEGLRRFYPSFHSDRSISITEIGCGGGDNLRAIKNWARDKKLNVTLKGIDINPECIQYAISDRRNSGINFIHSDYKDYIFDSKPDIIFSSLFVHHFSNPQVPQQLAWMRENSKLGFFINDLHRHALAYYSIKVLTFLFSKSYLVKNDAPLSVLRAFKKPELVRLMKQAGITNFKCEWKWSFRWLVICHNK